VPSRVLVVDDDPTVCEMIQDVLNSADMETVTHTSSQEAATRLELEKFQAVFLDVNMPSPDGLELARWIRASGLNRTTPIVMITGEDDRTILSRAFQAGASFFLFKPIDRHRMLRLIRVAEGPVVRRQQYGPPTGKQRSRAEQKIAGISFATDSGEDRLAQVGRSTLP
jgi:CheY-like chemotaxis protein